MKQRSLSESGYERLPKATKCQQFLSELDTVIPMPDESSVLQFRHRLERHGLAERLLSGANVLLSHQGLLLHQGTIVNATLIIASSSTKNQNRACDPEMQQTKKIIRGVPA